VQNEVTILPLKRTQDDALSDVDEEAEDDLIRSTRTPVQPKNLQKVKSEGSGTSKRQKKVLRKTKLPPKPQHKPVVDLTSIVPTRKGKRSLAYRKWKAPDLRNECRFRKLSTQGPKNTLIDRLCNDDNGINEEEGEEEEEEEEEELEEVVVEEEENIRGSYDSVSNQSGSDYE
jgi:SAP domain-containing protein